MHGRLLQLKIIHTSAKWNDPSEKNPKFDYFSAVCDGLLLQLREKLQKLYSSTARVITNLGQMKRNPSLDSQLVWQGTPFLSEVQSKRPVWFLRVLTSSP